MIRIFVFINILKEIGSVLYPKVKREVNSWRSTVKNIWYLS